MELNEEKDGKKIKEALYKKALGYTATEENLEYACQEGEMTLVKKKVTTKHVPPELSALKLILDENKDDYESMSEDELIKERNRLLKLLKNN